MPGNTRSSDRAVQELQEEVRLLRDKLSTLEKASSTKSPVASPLPTTADRFDERRLDQVERGLATHWHPQPDQMIPVRITVNNGDGSYDATELRWDSVTSEWIDSTETDKKVWNATSPLGYLYDIDMNTNVDADARVFAFRNKKSDSIQWQSEAPKWCFNAGSAESIPPKNFKYYIGDDGKLYFNEGVIYFGEAYARFRESQTGFTLATEAYYTVSVTYDLYNSTFLDAEPRDVQQNTGVAPWRANPVTGFGYFSSNMNKTLTTYTITVNVPLFEVDSAGNLYRLHEGDVHVPNFKLIEDNVSSVRLNADGSFEYKTRDLILVDFTSETDWQDGGSLPTTTCT